MGKKQLLLLMMCFCLMFSILVTPLVFSEVVPVGGVKTVRVYVVSLDGVDVSGVDNLSRIFEGVLLASKVDRIHYWTGEWEPVGMVSIPVMGEIPINVSVTAITDWTAYKILIEYVRNTIIVNAHGETLPVPFGYTKEEWVDKIAETMLNRNVTWVHVTGYPFYYYFQQELAEKEWGEEGFKRLMSHVGKNNVTCRPPSYGSESVSITGAAVEMLNLDFLTEPMEFVDLGKPLKSSEFSQFILLPLYRGGDYFTGATITFRKSAETYGSGFYVHLGAYQTYDPYRKMTERDFYRSYIATAGALWAYTMKTTIESAIEKAETAIIQAKDDGRTKDLDKATDLLRLAKNSFVSNKYIGPQGAIVLAEKAQKVATEAIKPSLIETYASHIVILSMVSMVTIGALIIRWRNNKRKKPG